VIIAWPGHPLAGARGVPAIELRHERIVQREPGSGTRAMLDTFLAMHRIEPRERLTVAATRWSSTRDVAPRREPDLDAHPVPGAQDRCAGAARRGRDPDRADLVRGAPRRPLAAAAAASFRDYLLDEGARKVATETRLLLTAEPTPA